MFIFFKAATALVYNIYVVEIFIFYVSVNISCVIHVSMLSDEHCFELGSQLCVSILLQGSSRSMTIGKEHLLSLIPYIHSCTCVDLEFPTCFSLSLSLFLSLHSIYSSFFNLCSCKLNNIFSEK